MPEPQVVAKNVLTIPGFLSSQECAGYIDRSEGAGFEDAPVTTETGPIIMKALRNNERVIVDDVLAAGLLWRRVREFLPVRFEAEWRPVGVNERLRFYRYDVGQQFDWHMDGYFERENGERSFFTFMIYLNDGFEGGETSFAVSKSPAGPYETFSVKPETGMALLFHHPISHKGEPVKAGRKYVLRSDVMFANR